MGEWLKRQRVSLWLDLIWHHLLRGVYLNVQTFHALYRVLYTAFLFYIPFLYYIILKNKTNHVWVVYIFLCIWQLDRTFFPSILSSWNKLIGSDQLYITYRSSIFNLQQINQDWYFLTVMWNMILKKVVQFSIDSCHLFFLKFSLYHSFRLAISNICTENLL